MTEAGVPHEFEAAKIPYFRKILFGECRACGTKEVYQRKVYIPDFKIGHNMFYEAKGRLVSTDRTKLLAVKKQHPEIELRLIFERDRPLNKGSPRMYSDWARENGFIYKVRDYTGTEWQYPW
jgi:hypothetical protein